MRIPSDDQEQILPNLTPVIDVVFLLLIFFLVATRFEQQEKDLKVRLPEVIMAEPRTTTKSFTINITKSGHYIILQKKYTKEEVRQRILEEKKVNPHKTVLIRADGRVELKYVAWVMGYCNEASLKYTLSVVPEE